MKSLKKGSLLAVLALVFTGPLHAQPSPPVEPATPSPAPSGAASQLSLGAMTTNAFEFKAQIRADTQRVQHLQAVARKEKDVIKLSCVNDKFVRLKAEANMFDTAHQELTGASDEAARRTAYESAVQAAERVHKIREAADGCIGEVELESGETLNGFTQPEIPDDPTTGLPFPDGTTVVEPPGYASPYS